MVRAERQYKLQKKKKNNNNNNFHGPEHPYCYLVDRRAAFEFEFLKIWTIVLLVASRV
jgi:hypothetical protein